MLGRNTFGVDEIKGSIISALPSLFTVRGGGNKLRVARIRQHPLPRQRLTIPPNGMDHCSNKSNSRRPRCEGNNVYVMCVPNHYYCGR